MIFKNFSILHILLFEGTRQKKKWLKYLKIFEFNVVYFFWQLFYDYFRQINYVNKLFDFFLQVKVEIE